MNGMFVLTGDRETIEDIFAYLQRYLGDLEDYGFYLNGENVTDQYKPRKTPPFSVTQNATGNIGSVTQIGNIDRDIEIE